MVVNGISKNMQKLREIYHVPDEVKQRMDERKKHFEEKEMRQNWFAKRLV